MGLTLVISTILTLTLIIRTEAASAATYRVTPAANEQQVTQAVAAAADITSLPKNLEPSLAGIEQDWGGDYEGPLCQPSIGGSTERICTLGDPNGQKLMVLYGDSHALMWIPAFAAVAASAHWRLVVLGKQYCPAEITQSTNPPGWQQVNGRYLPCERWHQWAIDWITRHRPNLVVVTQRDLYSYPSAGGAPPRFIPLDAWQQGLTEFLYDITKPGIGRIVLGDLPVLGRSPAACLSEHAANVQACSTSASLAVAHRFNAAERVAAMATNSRYIDITPWFCATSCSAVIDHYAVYIDSFHVTATYALYLQRVLSSALLAGRGR